MPIKYSNTTGGGIPFGDNSGRPGNPQIGQPFFNGAAARLELFTSATGWQNIVQETPAVVSVSGSYIESAASSTITINGTNFSSGATAYAVGSDGVDHIADTSSLISVVQISATFSGLSRAYEPYDIKVVNPSNLYGVLYDTLQVDDIPVWITQSGSLGTYPEDDDIEIQLAISDDENQALTFSILSGDLPVGISLDQTTGILSGTTPNINSQSSLYSFVVQATDGSNTTNRSFSINILENAPVWATPPMLSAYSSGSPYYQSIQASDDNLNQVSFSIFSGSLPTGLSLDQTTGAISGTPSVADRSYVFVARATDLVFGNYSDRQFTIPNIGPSWVSPQNLGYVYSDSNSKQIDATDDAGLTYSLIAGSLPAGMILTQGGVLSNASLSPSGTVSTFTIRVTDTAGNFIDREFSVATATRLYQFSSHTFTSSMSGGYRYGPTVAQARSTYSTAWDENTSYFSTPFDGIQRWTVPASGIYRFTVAGAKGGAFSNNESAGSINGGGRGAIIVSDIALVSGDVIYIVSGRRGGNYSGGQCGGGGGGSFVSKGAPYENSTLLIAAGGGGGGGNSGSVSLMDAQVGTSGGGWGAGSNGSGGIYGSGSESGSSGGGWLSSGTGAQPGAQVRQFGSPIGAQSVYGDSSNSGGFGGGAAGWGSPGGGGGYSGGGALTINGDSRCAGGGGGSYYTGSLVSAETGSSGNYADGYVSVLAL